MHIKSFYQRRRRPVLLTGLAAFTLLAFWLLHHDSNRDYYLKHDLIHAYNSTSNPTFDDRKALCQAHNFPPSPTPQKKLYDLILLSTELDWLEIRLHTLAPYVDYFVILEATTTFTGRERETLLTQPEVWKRFEAFKDKIIHRVVDDPVQSERIWDHEDWIRNALLTEVFPSLEGEQKARKGDILAVSDMDELIRPETAIILKACEIPKRLFLRSRFFYYSFQWQHVGEQWAHPQATVWQGSVERTLRPNDLKQDILPPTDLFAMPWQTSSCLWVPYHAWRRWYDKATIWDAGWHCSSCFSTVKEFRTKMASFSHASLNTEENRDPQRIVERVKNGEDLFGRQQEKYEIVAQEELDLPEYVWREYERQGRFGYLVDRRGEDAGFESLEGLREGSREQGEEGV